MSNLNRSILILLFFVFVIVQGVGAADPPVVASFTTTAPPKPIISVSTDVVSGIAPLTVHFTFTITNPNPKEWTFWNLSLEDVLHNGGVGPGGTYWTNDWIFRTPGIYTISANASNSGGIGNTVTQTITVNGIVTFTPTPLPTPTIATTTFTPTQVTTSPTTQITTAPATTTITTGPTTSQTTITIITPKPTTTVNYSATIAAMQSQIAEQNARISEQGNILNQIMTFLRNVFGLK